MRRLFSLDNFRKYLLTLTLASIFVLALGVRLYGINFGLPYAEEPDEPAIMDHVLTMVQAGDWSPHWLVYPSPYLYAQSVITRLYIWWAQLQGKMSGVRDLQGVHYPTYWMANPDLYMWARMLSVLIGAATVLVLYKAARELFSQRVGLVAAAILALTYLHVQYSHFIRTDITLTFFATVTVYFSARLYKTGQLRDYVFAGAAIGMTVAGKYNGFLICVTVIVAHLARVIPSPRSSSLAGWRKWLDPRVHLPLFYAALVSVTTFFVTSPSALVEPNVLIAGLQNGTDVFDFAGLRLENISYYIGYFMLRGGLGDLLTLLAICGVILAFVRRTPRDLIGVIFPASYFFMILFNGLVRIRMALPLAPSLALMAALSLVTFVEWAGRQWKRLAPVEVQVLVVLAVALLIGPTLKILNDDASMSMPTTRALATEWAAKHLPAGARVLSEANGIYIQTPQVEVTPTDLTDTTVEKLQADDIDYAVTSDSYVKRARNLPGLLRLQSFEPGINPGPFIRVLQVPPLPLPLELVDAKLEHSKFAPGEQARITLHWRASSSIGANHTEFVRLLASDETTAYELAQAPQQGIGKMKKWPAGSVITDTHILEIPQDLPSGVYPVRVGFYREETEFPLALRAPNGEAVRALGVGSIVVAPRLPPAGRPETQTDIRFGDQLRLTGYTIGNLVRGQPLDLRLVWSAGTSPMISYTRFVHLLDAQGKIVTQEDAIPLNGNYPTTIWEANALIEDVAHLALPSDIAAGTYTLQVGWYNATTKERLRTPDGGDSAVLHTVVIGKE